MRAYTGFLRVTLRYPLPDTAGRHRPVRRLDLEHIAAADRLHPGGRRRAHRHLAGTAAGRDARRHRAAPTDDSRPHPEEHAGSTLGLHHGRHLADRRQPRGAPGDSAGHADAQEQRVNSRQKQVEGEISRRLADVPDIRSWYVNERGERELSITVMGNDGTRSSDAVASLEAAMRREPGFANVGGQRRRWTGRKSASCPAWTRPPVTASRRKPSPRRSGSPPSAMPTPTSPSSTPATARSRSASSFEEVGPQRSAADRDPARSPAAGGIAIPLTALADVGFGQGPVLDRALRPGAPGADRRRPVGGMTLGDAVAKVKSLPEAAQPAGRRPHPGKRRRRDHGRGLRRLRCRHGRRPADGAGRAGPAVRQRLPADHDPAVAAAVDRRRDRGPAADRQRRSACRS